MMLTCSCTAVAAWPGVQMPGVFNVWLLFVGPGDQNQRGMLEFYQNSLPAMTQKRDSTPLHLSGQVALETAFQKSVDIHFIKFRI